MLLNTNARRYRPAFLARLRELIPEEDIFVSASEADADRALAEIVARRYPLMFCGGGDGTAMHALNRVYHCVRERNDAGEAVRAPAMGFLKLGTGNGWAVQMGTPDGIAPVEIVRNAAWSDLRFTPSNLLAANGLLFDRGGMGLDALTINSFVELNKRFAGSRLRPLVRGLAGYWAALFFKSFPHLIAHGLRADVRVFNQSTEPVWRMSETGEPVETNIGPGGLIHEGPVLWVGFGTIRVGGYGFVMFPHALKKHGWMNLRIMDISLPRAMRNLRSIYRGVYTGPGFHEFLAQDVRVEFDREMPFHRNGDAQGFRREVRVSVAEFEL